MKKIRRTYAFALLILALCTFSFLLISCGENEPVPSELLTDESGNTLDLSSDPASASDEETGASQEPTIDPPDAPTKETAEPSEAATEAESAVPSESESEAVSETEAETEGETALPSGVATLPSSEPTRAPVLLGKTDAEYADADLSASLPTVTVEKTENELKTGILYDTSISFSGVFDAVALYDLCPTVSGVRVYALIDQTPTLSQKAAAALAALCEAAYRETGMRVHVRTVAHMNESYVGYADYQSQKSVKLGYHDGTLYHDFDAAAAAPLAEFIRENAYLYGFADLSAKDDAGHFRYVSVPHAAAMRDHGFDTLYAYAAFLSARTSPLKISLADVTYYVISTAYTNGSFTYSLPAAYLSSYEASATGHGTAVLTLTSYKGGFANPLPYVASPDTDRSKTVICLDAGHGDHDPGAVWPQTSSPTYLEKEYNLLVALEAKAYLEAMGYTVVMTRADDSFLALGERVSYAKAQNTDLFISFHCNSTATPESVTAVGPQVYFNQSENTQYLNWTTARAFAAAINTATASYIAKGEAESLEEADLRNGSDLAVLRDYALPSVLLEMGFITNEGDRALFEDAAWRESMGYAVALAVESLFANDHLGVK